MFPLPAQFRVLQKIVGAGGTRFGSAVVVSVSFARSIVSRILKAPDKRDVSASRRSKCGLRPSKSAAIAYSWLRFVLSSTRKSEDRRRLITRTVKFASNGTGALNRPRESVSETATTDCEDRLNTSMRALRIGTITG